MKIGKILSIIIIIVAVLSIIIFLSRDTENLYSQLSEQIYEIDIGDDLDEILKRIEDKDYVLLGESSHGTSEYYIFRKNITKELIERQNYSFVVIEGDWPYIYQTNRYVKDLDNTFDNGKEALTTNSRWPEWLWANEEFLNLVEWVREYNENLSEEERIGIYGFDMQNLEAFIKSSNDILTNINPELLDELNSHLMCFSDYDNDLMIYAQNYSQNQISCQESVEYIYDSFLQEYSEDEIFSSANLFNLKQNILGIKYAERYARDIIIGNSTSWNTRVKYMTRTTENLSRKYGSESKGIIWAHNTHVGDSRATEMKLTGMDNIGKLLREKEYDTFILGFSTYTGQVIASYEWEQPMQIMDIPSGGSGSVERKLESVGKDSFILFFDEIELPEQLKVSLPHRAKGVVYDPLNDRHSYVRTVLPERYDAFIFIRETSALTPL